MNHKHYTPNEGVDQPISASKLVTQPTTESSRLLTPNVVYPDDIKYKWTLETYRNAPFTNIRVEKLGKHDDLLVESASKKHNHGRLNSPVTCFSPKQKRAMRKVFSKIDRVTIYEDDRGVQLMTFTFKNYVEDAEELKRIWKNFRACLYDHYPEACGVFRWDFSPDRSNPRSHPHIHFVCYGLQKMPRRSRVKREFLEWVSSTWHYCAYGDVDGELGRSINEKHSKVGVNVQEARSQNAIENYISEYVAQDDVFVPDWWEGYHWGKHNPKGLDEFQTKEELLIHDELVHEAVHDLICSDIDDKIRRSAMYANRILVSNLSVEVEEEDLKTIFSEFGEVEEVEVKRKKDGTSRGYASLQMINRSEAKSAVNVLNGKTFKGSELKIKYDPKFVIHTEFFNSRTDMYGTETDGYYFSKEGSNEEIKSDFVDYYGDSTPIVRRAFHPVTMEFEGYLIPCFKEADISKGDDPVLPPLDYWSVVRDDGTKLPFELQNGSCRFLKSVRSNKSISSSSFAKFDELEIILNQDKVIKGFIKDCDDLQQQAVDFGMSFEELAKEVSFPLRTTQELRKFKDSYRVDQRSTYLTYMTNSRKDRIQELAKMN